MSRKDVETGEQNWLKAFNGGDASAVAACYTENGRILPPNADIVEGRAAIEAFGKEFISMGAQLSFKLLTVHEAPDMCVAVGQYEMEIPSMPNDRGKFMETWRRQSDGSWQIADDIFNSSLPAPAPE